MSRIPDRLVIASRGSRLALRQADLVAALVRSAHPSIEVDIRTVRTRGDADKRPFRAIGAKGLFTTEVEREVLEGRADVAVHSAKDLTATLGPGGAIVCVPERAAVHDVVVGSQGSTGEERLAALPTGARVGTSSVRRRALLLEARPDLEVADLRGNLDTRLRKVASGEVDAAIVAAAGVQRLEGDASATHGRLDPGRWVPPPGQGALAIEGRDDRDDLAELFAPLGDRAAAAELASERAFAVTLEGGCSVPLGCLARASSGHLLVTGFLGAPDGSYGIRDRISGGLHEAEALGRQLAEAILSAGGDDILADLEDEELPEPSAP